MSLCLRRCSARNLSVAAAAFTFTILVGTTAPSLTSSEKASLVIGDTFTVESKAVGATRRINVYLPPGYSEAADKRFLVLYMPDGGIAEDFLHVAGLVQVSAGEWDKSTIPACWDREYRTAREMTRPTENAEDKKIAPRVGESEAFRRFVRTELMPEVKARYRTTNETAVAGESLAGLWGGGDFSARA